MMCDIYTPIRAGTDIAFLGGLINYVLTNERWFREYALAFTNAATLVNENYVDADDLGGLFNGYLQEKKHYEPGEMAWNYQGEPAGAAKTHTPPQIKSESLSERLGFIQNVPPPSDPTLKDPRCVLNVVRRHYARYTPEMVASICGCTEE